MRKFTQSWQTNWIKKINRYAPSLVAIALFGIAGTWLLVGSHAATPAAPLQAEAGNASSAAAVLSDSTASGSSAVKFGASSGGGGATTSTCPAYPAFPDASCTGPVPGTTFKTIPTDATSGPGWTYNSSTDMVTISGNNVTFSGYIFDGTLLIKGGNGDIIRNNKLSNINGGSGDFIVQVGYVATNVTVDHNEIFGSGVNGPKCIDYGLNAETSGGNVGAGYVVTNNNIHGMDHPIQSETGTYQDNYVHNICGNGKTDPSTETHSDTFFSGGGDPTQLNLIHNVLTNDDTSTAGATAAIMLNNAFGVQANRLIQYNLFGGGGYVIYGGQPSSGTPASYNIVVKDNSFTTSQAPNGGGYGPVAAWNASGTGNVWQNNTWYDGPKKGTAVTP